MERKPRTERREHWVLSESMKAHFIRIGHPEYVNNQFMIDKMMEASDFFKNIPFKFFAVIKSGAR